MIQYFLDEFSEQIKILGPVIFGNIFYRIPWLISLHVVGSIHPYVCGLFMIIIDIYCFMSVSDYVFVRNF